MLATLKGLLVRLRVLTRPAAADRDLDEEIGFHIELETEKNLRLGMSPAEARRRALVAFGGVQRFREEHRDVRHLGWLQELGADARFAVRALRRSPALAGAAVLTLAIGIGASTAIFSAVNAVILRPLPFPRPDQLVMLWEENVDRGWLRSNVAPANALDWREQVSAFEDAAAYSQGGRLTLTGDFAPRIVTASSVTGTFFSVLGVRPRIGREFREEETWVSGEPIAIISHRLWRDVYGSDPRITERTIELEGTRRQVVGVMPDGFAFPTAEVDVWMPTAWPLENRAEVWFRRAHFLKAVARLRPDASPARADAQLREVAMRLQSQYPETNTNMGAGLTPLHEFLVGNTRLPLLVVLSAVGLLLLIACANVANLLLVRASEREREVALRLALGARRGRLVRQALTESLVLSCMGGAAGLAVGAWGTRALASLQPAGLLRVQEFGMDWRVLAFVVAITTACGVIFGIVPAIWSGGRQPADALREGGRSGSQGKRARRWGELLAIGEVAIALLLTVGAGLLVRSYRELLRVNPGFDPTGALAVSMNMPTARYPTGDAIQAFVDGLEQRVRALPGVEATGVVSQLPLMGTNWTTDFIAAGRAPTQYGTEVALRSTSAGYFDALRVPVVQGRGFTELDRAGASPVAVINQELARTYFAGEDPIGQRIALARAPDSTTTWWTIVGVVGNEHQTSLGAAPMIEIHVPFAQRRRADLDVLVRTRGDPGALGPAIRAIVAELDAELAIQAIQPMSDVHAQSLARERYFMTILLVFAGIGLLLAVVGIYGVLAQVARARTREMGIRIALGARGAQVRWMLVRHGLRLTVIGLMIGAVVALGATQAMQKLLFGVPASDPATFGAVALLILATGLVAAWLPALKASRAEPIIALRTDQ